MPPFRVRSYAAGRAPRCSKLNRLTNQACFHSGLGPSDTRPPHFSQTVRPRVRNMSPTLTAVVANSTEEKQTARPRGTRTTEGPYPSFELTEARALRVAPHLTSTPIVSRAGAEMRTPAFRECARGGARLRHRGASASALRRSGARPRVPPDRKFRLLNASASQIRLCRHDVPIRRQQTSDP
jgi:hypothetical protein